MSVLILAPVFKVLKKRIQLVVRVSLQVPVYADIPPVADLQTSTVCVRLINGSELRAQFCAMQECESVRGQDGKLDYRCTAG